MKTPASFDFVAFSNLRCLSLNLVILHIFVRGRLLSFCHFPARRHMLYPTFPSIPKISSVFLATHQYGDYSVTTCLPTPPAFPTHDLDRKDLPQYL